MEINQIPAILYLIPVIILALVLYLFVKRKSDEDHLYDKRWKIYNKNTPPLQTLTKNKPHDTLPA